MARDPNQSARWRLIISTLGVAGAWAACLWASLLAFRPTDIGKIERYGQFGDAFGTVNALFTGLGLIAVIVTLRLQQRQLDEQRLQFKSQTREQFLSARINLAVAELQARSAEFDIVFNTNTQERKLDKNEALEYELGKKQALRALNRTGVRLSLLRHEAKQGFDGHDWTPSVEKESIRLRLVDLLESFADVHDRDGSERMHPAVELRLKQTRNALEVLIDMFHRDHPDIAKSVKGAIDMIDNHKANPTQLVTYCKNARIHFCRGAVPWV
jgi:hypothetical protein